MSIITGDILFNLITIIIGVVTAVIIYCKWSFQYWKDRGVTHLEPKLIWGNLRPPHRRIISIGDEVAELYKKAKQNGWKQLGFYNMTEPIYMPIDLNILKHIITKDFSHFVDRGLYVNEKNEPISAHLFAIGGTKWRNLRIKFTPTFTSGKMRTMFKTITVCGDQLNRYLIEKITLHEPVDIKDILGNFSTDIIGSCAFGLECNSFKDPDSPFRQIGRKVFDRTRFENLKFIFANNFPKVANLLDIRLLDAEVSNFFTKVVADSVKYREENHVHRNDFLQLLIEIKNQAKDGERSGDGSTLTLDEMVAQSFVFFVAGFETSSTTMTYALYELARNPDIQRKVRDEINFILNKYGGEVTYDCLSEMKYLSQVIDETLRMYPAVPFITRKCVEEYVVPETNLKMSKGTRVWIPIKGIHYDEDYYSNPKVFNPERFSDENKRNRNQYAFIPFGEGPRMCIGMRFGIVQTKVGLINVLRNFEIRIDKKTKTPLETDINSFIPKAEGGIWLNMEKI
ncbi:probable cytochrome P450 6a14 [Diorhabda carinulata]|uniref:probable cytochrome P450 6a14 n=1 Tax=Diorhabda carinulata TaxID=1163345 RepID=UPI0025A04458|nr:probable cytochrome P450 6a14 [Diorhabda carinulata]XP_057650974.1 probable cytochrome P450 6a14 [Diorhabda carinulata]XP_057650975.1 probable cytochrome P450 6a14 [Diorhabda carinulata]